MKSKKIIIDADYLIFEVAEGKYIKQNTFDNEKVKLKPFKDRFKMLVKDIEDEVSVALLGKFKIKGKVKLSFSDPNNNFRYDIYPEYKGNRKRGERSELFYRVRKWALKKYGYVEDIEADDEVSHYVQHKGYVGCSFDKDCLKGVPGIWFDVYHNRRHIIKTSIVDARNFNFLQTLMGDPTDNIKGVPRVGEKTAVKLLDEFGWSDYGVLKSYENKGLSVDDMVLNRRLICLNQWSPKNGVKLWEYEDDK